MKRFKEWLRYHYVAWYHRHIPGFQVWQVRQEGGGGREWGSAGGGLAVWGFFSSCSFCVPRPPWGRSIWGCSQCRAGPAAASGWPRRWCWDGSDSGCRCGTPRPSPAPGRRPARPTAAAPGTWRGCGSGGGSCGGERTKTLSATDTLLYERVYKGKCALKQNKADVRDLTCDGWIPCGCFRLRVLLLIVHAGQRLYVTSEYNRDVLDTFGDTCALPTVTSQNALCEEGLQNDCRTSDVTWKHVHGLNLTSTVCSYVSI